ncbi:MAG: FHA domain-containing protein [Vulcanimicrobiota bacterium]
MILKRWALHLVALIVGAMLGLFLVEFAGRSLAIPNLASILICLIFMGLSVSLSVLMAPQLFPLQSADVIRPEIPRQNWAWLRPRGDSMRSGFPLNKDQVVIGREVRCDVMLNHASVSRQHSAIVRLAEGYLLRDLNSSNGTFVNGQRIQEYLLQSGDLVVIGDLQFTFEGPSNPALLGQAHEAGLSPGLSLDPTGGGPTLGLTRAAEDDDEEEGTEVWRPRTR